MGDAQRRDGSGPNRAGSNPPLYYAYEAIPYRVLRGQDLFTRLMGMRLASGVLTVLIVVMVWAIAGEVFGPDPWRRTIATGVAALHPMLGYIGSMVSPDALLAFIWTAFVLLAMRTLRRGPSIRRLLGAAALAVASVLTHGRGVAIVVPLLVLVLATGWRFQSVLATTLRRHRLAAGATVVLLLSPVLAWLALTLVVPGGGLLYGSQASIDGASFSVKQLLGVTWQFYFDRLPFMEPRIGPPYGYRQVYIETFFGTFGSLEVTFPGWVYDGIQLAVAIGLAALLATAIRHMKAVRRNAAVVLVLASVALAMIALLHVASYVNLLKDPSDPIFTGRYLLPLISLLGLAVAWVIGSLPRLASHIAGATLLGIGVLLSLAALGLSAARFYA